MAEFDDADLRPFSSVSRPRTSAAPASARQMTDGMAARPMTAMSVVERQQFEPVRPMTSSGRAVASGPDGPSARPVTAGRPKTGYSKAMAPPSRLGTAAGRDNWQVCTESAVCQRNSGFLSISIHSSIHLFLYLEV